MRGPVRRRGGALQRGVARGRGLRGAGRRRGAGRSRRSPGIARPALALHSSRGHQPRRLLGAGTSRGPPLQVGGGARTDGGDSVSPRTPEPA